MPVENLTEPLRSRVVELEFVGFSNLNLSNYRRAENIYQKEYEVLARAEKKLPEGSKYHKGSPLFNWGIALIGQNKIPQGFEKILLAYIEDLLNYKTADSALDAPAHQALYKYPLIEKGLLSQLLIAARKVRQEGIVPREPEKLLKEIPEDSRKMANFTEYLTKDKTDQYPAILGLTKIPAPEEIPETKLLLDQIGPRDKRVFVGGNHFNIVLLRCIKETIEHIDDFKAVLVADVPSALNTHDKSMELLKECAHAIFEISISNGHLMEIERATDFEKNGTLKYLLLYQGFRTQEEPKATKMLEKFKDHMVRYTNLTELTIEINKFLSA